MTIQEIIKQLEKVDYYDGCREFLGITDCECCETNKNCLKTVALHTAKLLKESLDEQTLKDAEGVPICVDDVVWQTAPYDGKNHEKCKVVNANHKGMLITWSDEFGLAWTSAARVTHNEPDSWEKLEKDACKSLCDYFSHEVYSCESCPVLDTSDDCRVAFTKDIIRRAKALADKQK